MRSLINTNGQQSDTGWLLGQSRRTSDAQIEHQTEWLQDEKDLTLKGLLRKCVRNSTRPHVALQKSARREMPTQEARFRKIRSLRLKSRLATFYGCVPERFAGS
jgi:hypothetical protein